MTLGGTLLKEDEEVTYLGVTFDKKHTCKPHIAKADTQAAHRLAIVCKLAGTTWEACEKILKTFYKGTAKSHLKYGFTAWSTTAKINQQTSNTVQNQAPSLITLAMWSTLITEMESLTDVQPLGQRRDAKILMQADRVQVHPKSSHENKAGGSHQEPLDEE